MILFTYSFDFDKEELAKKLNCDILKIQEDGLYLTDSNFGIIKQNLPRAREITIKEASTILIGY